MSTFRNLTTSLLCIVVATLLTACSDKTEAERLQITPESITFTAEKGMQQTITIEANAAWEVTYLPDWVSLSVTKGNSGSTPVTLTTTSRNTTNVARANQLVVKAGSAQADITITQNPRVQDCTADTANVLVMSYAFACQFKCGSKTSYFRYKVYDDKEYRRIERNLEENTEDSVRTWESQTAGTPFQLIYEKCEPGQTYHLLTIGYDTDNTPAALQRFPISTKSLVSVPAAVEISLPSTEADEQGGVTWKWNVTKLSTCQSYLTYACVHSEKFQSYILAENQTDKKRRGMWLAYQIFNARKIDIQESYPSFNIKGDGKQEILHEMMDNNAVLSVKASRDDRYMEVLTWCVSKTDGQFIGIVQDSIYTIENGSIVDPNEPERKHTHVEPDKLTFEAEDAPKSVRIESNEAWTSESDAKWCSITPDRGSKGTTVTITVQPNTSTDTRTAHITVIGTESGDRPQITITQKGAKPQQEYHTSVTSSTSLTFEAAADNTGQTITVKSNEQWTASSNKSWCKVTPSGGTNDGTVTVTVEANTSTERKAEVIIKGSTSNDEKKVTVTQKAPHTYVSAKSVVVPSAHDTFEIKIDESNEPWTAETETEATWLTVKTKSGNGTGKVLFDVEENTSTEERKANITIKGTLSGDKRDVEVTQNGNAYIDVLPDSLTFGAAADNMGQEITVDSNVQWTVGSDKSWCKVNYGNHRTVVVTVEANTSSSDRIAYVTIQGSSLKKEVKVKQKGKEDDSLTIDRTDYGEDKKI